MHLQLCHKQKCKYFTNSCDSNCDLAVWHQDLNGFRLTDFYIKIKKMSLHQATLEMKDRKLRISDSRQEHSKENMQDRKEAVILRKGCKSKEVANTKNDSLPSSKAIIKEMEGPVHIIGLRAFVQNFAESKDAHSDKLRCRSGFFDGTSTKYETQKKFNYSIIHHGCMNCALVTAAEHRKCCTGSIPVGKESIPLNLQLCDRFFSSFALKCCAGCHIYIYISRYYPKLTILKNHQTQK